MTSIPLKLPFNIKLTRPVNPTGIWDWLTTIDHKKIGILFGPEASGLSNEDISYSNYIFKIIL